MLGPIIKLLKPLLEHRDDPKRKLHYDSFYVWLLVCYFTPILDSMRGLQQASDLPEIQKRLNLPASRCYPLMAAMLDSGSSFVGRVRNNAVYETIEEREITDAGRAENIVADRIVRAGCDASHDKIDRPLRLIEIHVPDTGPSKRSRVDPKSKACRTRSTDHTILLLTDRLDLDAETIAVLFRHRWQVELFFRWFKKVLNADKLLSLSEDGLTIVMYCALIASMLVTLWTGRKPTKRTFDLLCIYFYGLASDEDLIRHIEKLKVAEKKTSNAPGAENSFFPDAPGPRLPSTRSRLKFTLAGNKNISTTTLSQRQQYKCPPWRSGRKRGFHLQKNEGKKRAEQYCMGDPFWGFVFTIAIECSRTPVYSALRGRLGQGYLPC
ncbi:MAG: transposase [Candidatus Sumerlaeota bacterium]